MATPHRKPTPASDIDSDPAFVPAIPSLEPDSERPARVAPPFALDPDPASDPAGPSPETPPRFPRARKTGSGEFPRLPVRETVVDPDSAPIQFEADGRGDSSRRAASAASEMTMREAGDERQGELEAAPRAADLDGDGKPPRLDNADFILRRRIGRGGQADVWRAVQPSLDREIAVKIIRSDRREEAVGFLQEAFTSAELDHPNIAPVYELSQSRVEGRDCHVLAMKLIKGKGWHEQLVEDRAAKSFSLEVFLAKHLKIFADVCNAVSYAHSKGIIHRDIKPRQVVIGKFGETFLLDWGLAISLRDNVPEVARADNLPKFRAAETATDRSGSPAYMAPEQAQGGSKALGLHTDVYLLGATLYELVAGAPPHAATTASEACLLALANVYPPLPADCPEELRLVVAKAMAMEPSARYGDVAALREEVEEYLSGAGRQRESRDIAELAREWLRDAGDAAGYDVFGDIDKLLGRSLALWPSNHEAFELRQRVYALYSDKAIASGDLQLAKSLLPSLVEPERREEGAARLRLAEARAARHVRQRRELFAASGLLLGLLLVAAGFAVYQGLAAAKEAARRESMELASNEQEKLAELFAFRERENDLSQRLLAAFPSPTSLSVSAALSVEERRAWERELAEAAADRSRLASRPFGRAALGDAAPMELLLAEANLALARHNGASDGKEAIARFERAHEQYPSRPEPMTGMGLAAAMAGDIPGAVALFSRAARRSLELHGARHPEHLRALALKAEAIERLDSSSPEYERFSRESVEQLEPIWAEISDTLAARWSRLGRHDLALDYSSASLAAHRRLLGESHPATAAARAIVLESLRRQGREEEASAIEQRP